MTIPTWPPGPGARVRADLAALPAYVAGRKSPGAVVLASNESPYGLLPGVGELLAEAAQGTSRYPDMGATALVEAIAAHHEVGPERVAVGAGSVEVLGQLGMVTATGSRAAPARARSPRTAP